MKQSEEKGIEMRILSLLLSILFVAALYGETDWDNYILWSFSSYSSGVRIESGVDYKPAISQTTAGAIKVPSALIKGTVTGIGPYAFYGCNRLTGITIPSSVRLISGSAFVGCTSLTEINLSGNNEWYSLRNGILCDKNGTTVVAVPGGMVHVEIPQGIKSIGMNAFRECVNLKSVIIPDSVESIGENAFYGCKSLTQIKVPNSVRDIGERAFFACDALENICLSINISKIREEAFYGCKSLKNIILPDGVTHIYNYAFGGCDNLLDVKLPNSITYLGAYPFTGSTAIQNVTVPQYICEKNYKLSDVFPIGAITNIVVCNGVTKLSDYIFSDCYSLKSIILPNTITNIAKYAFESCTSLELVKIPQSVKKIEANAFDSCINLATIILANDEDRIDMDCAFSNCEGIKNLIIPGSMLKESSIADIFPDAYFSLTNIILTGTTRIINDNAFKGCAKLKSVNIPSSVLYIGKNVFGECDSLNVKADGDFLFFEDIVVGYMGSNSSVEIPIGVRGVSGGVFCGHDEIKDVVFPATLEFIGKEAFAQCTGLEKILLPNGIIDVNDSAFKDCTFASEVLLPKRLCSIGDFAFANCSSLIKIECCHGVESIGEGAFSNCWRALSVKIPSSIEYIGNNAFYDCRYLLGVEVPGHLKKISELFPNAYKNLTTIEIAIGEDSLVSGFFSGCASVEDVDIPETIESIPDDAFIECTSICSLELHDGITNIGARAFKDLSNIDEFTFPKRLKVIGDSAFGGCFGMSNIKLPYGLVSIESNAFRGLHSVIHVDIPGSVTNVGVAAFGECSSIRTISLPGEVGVISKIFPQTYSRIVSASITSGSEYLVDNIFSDCSSLTSIVLPVSCKKIGAAAFKNCIALSNLGIPVGVQSMGEDVFYGCRNLLTMALPEGIRNIPERAFYNCDSLAELIIPSSVKEIGNNAFYGCSLLSAIKFIGNAPLCEVGAYNGTEKSLVTYASKNSTGWDGIITSKVLPEFWPEESGHVITWWEPNRLSVTFEPNGGDGLSFNVEQVTGTTYILPPDATRRGAVFEGWWTSLDGGARVTAVTPVNLTRPHTFYARWKFNAYSVVFNANGGSGEMEDQRLTVETPVQLPENGFTRAGYAFLGWATEPDGEVVYSDKAEVVNLAYDNNAIVTLYAVWNEREWTWADAVDATSIGLVFSGDRDNDAEWEIDYSTNHDGVASLRSGSIGASTAYPERTMSTVKTVVVGEGVGEFWWKVNCEEMDSEYDEWYDYVVFTIDGVEVAKIAGDSGWQKVEYAVTGAGKHTLAWTFTRDNYDEEGAGWGNAAWLDEFVWTPNPVTVTFDAGGADGDVPDPVIKYAGYELTLPGAGTLNNGEYVFRGWSDGETTYQAGSNYVFGSDDVTLTAIWELKVWTFAEAADAEGLVLTTGGDADWTIDATSGYTNTMSVKSGVVVSGQESWIETKVNGSGTLTFRWKVMGGENRNQPFAFAKVMVDGVQIATEYLTDEWEELSLPIEGNKEHTVRWIYLRTSTREAEGDCAWIDAVTWMGGARYNIAYENLKGATHQNPSAYYAGMSVKFTVPSTVDGYAFTGWMPSEITASDTGNKIVTANWEWTPQDALVDASITGGKPITVKADWVKTELEKKFGVGKKDEFIAKFGDNLASAMTKKTGKRDGVGNELLVWHDYVAGTDPTDVKSTFKAKIEMQNGKPIISWEPNLNSLGEERVYTVYGKESLSDIWHTPIAVLDHFFKVDVLMPYDITVILNTVEGSSVGPLTVRVGQPLGELPTPTRVGYTFLGWFTAQEGGEAVTPETIVTADMTIYARWAIKSYTVVFDANGGSGGVSKSYNHGSTLDEMPVPTRDGYTFTGWFTTASGGTQVTAGTVVTADTTIYAWWTLVVAQQHDKVQLWEGGPYWATTNIGAEKPEDYGYYFWWGDTVGYKRENDDKWVASDGSNSNFLFRESNTPTYGKDNPTLQSQGWITAEGVLASEHDAAKKHWGGYWRIPTQQELDDLNNKCDWEWTTLNGAKGYVVRGRGSYASVSIFLPAAGFGSDNLRLNAWLSGYYWSSVPNSSKSYAWSFDLSSNNYNTDSGIRYVGQPVRPVQGAICVILDACGGSSIDSISIPFGQALGEMPVPTWDGYIFLGWFTAQEGGEAVTPETIVTADMMIYARWAIKSYTVVFDANGGSGGVSKSYNHGATLGEMPVPTRDGYTFTGWFTALSGGTQVAASTVVTGPNTLYAKWTIKSYTVVFDANGGSGGVSKSYNHGATLGEMPVPTRDGYAFTGWFTASEGGNPVTSETVVSADMTIYARWESVISAGVHEKVQLWEGGPYWATTNIGAENPEDYGYYFWWGDTVGYKRENDIWVSSDESNYIFSFNDINTPTYRKLYSALQNGGWITSDGVLAPAHDAVQKHWGGDWRMPTKQEFADLNSKCVWTWGSMNGVNGYIVCGMGDYASNSIFLPCAGCGRWASLDNAGSYGRYWSSVPDSSYDDACCLGFVSSGHGMSNSFRYEGLPLRPVQGLAK